MANSVNITGSDFSELNVALDKVAKRSAQSARFMSRIFNTEYSGGKTFAGLDKLSNRLKEVGLDAAALKSTLQGIGAVGVRSPSAASSRASSSGGAGGAGGARKLAGGDAGGDEDFELKAMTKYRRSFVRFEKREADFLAKQRENSANETYKRIVAKSKEEAKIKDKLAADVKKRDDLNLRLQKKSENKIDVPELSLYKKAGSYADKIAKATAKSDSSAAKAINADERARIAEMLKLEREIKQLEKQTTAKNAQAVIQRQKDLIREQKRQSDELAKLKKIAVDEEIRREKAFRSKRDAVLQQRGQIGNGIFGDIEARQKREARLERILSNTFGLKSKLPENSMLRQSGMMISKFGNPGQMPLVSRFRVFQRPFPGSERNPFSLGDTGNIANNAISALTTGVRTAFNTITTAGTDVVRAFSAVTQGGVSLVSSFFTAFRNVPFIGIIAASVGAAFELLGSIISSVTNAFTGLVDGISKAIGETITALGTVALGLSGFAHRAVVAASTLTELKNAASIYAGAEGSKGMVATATKYQQDYGLSAADSLRMMTRFAGQIRQTTGVGSEQAGQEAQALFRAAADAGSVLNMDLATIGNIAQSAMAGRYTPLRRMGVTVSADYLDTVAKTQGFDKDAKTPFAARTKALEYEILRQTKGFVGDLEATQYEFANQQRKLLGIFEAAFVHVGRALEPFARVIMIASTTVGSIFVKQLETFGDWIQKSFQDMVDFKDGGKLQIYLAAVTKAAARAADYLLYFADKLYENKDVIFDFVKRVGEALYKVALDLLRFSLTMVAAMASFFKMLPNLVDSLKMFAQVLDGIARKMDKKFNLGVNDDAALKAAKEDQAIMDAKEANAKDENALKNGRFNGFMGNNLKPVDILDLKNDIRLRNAKIAAMQGRKDQVNALVAGGMNQKDAEEKVFGNDGKMPWADNMAAGLENMAIKGKKMLDDLEKNGLGGVFPNVPRKVDPEDLWGKLLMQMGNRPDFGDPEPFKGKGGRLSQYFDPAAYRDEIQTRELTAAEQTAQNTFEMKEQLNQLANGRMLAQVGGVKPALTVA